MAKDHEPVDLEVVDVFDGQQVIGHSNKEALYAAVIDILSADRNETSRLQEGGQRLGHVDDI